jgi:hypothetical protein
LEDRRISAKSIGEQLGISRERVGFIIHEDLDMLVACFLPGRAKELSTPLYTFLRDMSLTPSLFFSSLPTFLRSVFWIIVSLEESKSLVTFLYQFQPVPFHIKGTKGVLNF